MYPSASQFHFQISPIPFCLSPLQVRVGEWHLEKDDDTEIDFAVSQVHIHENYGSPKRFSNDIALIELAEPVDFSSPYAGQSTVEIFGSGATLAFLMQLRSY